MAFFIKNNLDNGHSKSAILCRKLVRFHRGGARPGVATRRSVQTSPYLCLCNRSPPNSHVQSITCLHTTYKLLAGTAS
jgi:hypothetical protein